MAARPSTRKKLHDVVRDARKPPAASWRATKRLPDVFMSSLSAMRPSKVASKKGGSALLPSADEGAIADREALTEVTEELSEDAVASAARAVLAETEEAEIQAAATKKAAKTLVAEARTSAVIRALRRRRARRRPHNLQVAVWV